MPRGLLQLSPLQLQKELAVQEGCCHIGPRPWAPSLSVLQLKTAGASVIACDDAWVLRLSSLQLKRILGVQAGDCHCMYHPWTLFSCSSTESKLSSKVKASAKLAVSVVRLSEYMRKRLQRCENGDRFFPWFLRSSSSRFSKSAIILSLLHMAPFPAAPVSQCDRRNTVCWIKYHSKPRRLKRAYDQAARFVKTNDDTHMHVHRPALNADSIPRKKLRRKL